MLMRVGSIILVTSRKLQKKVSFWSNNVVKGWMHIIPYRNNRDLNLSSSVVTTRSMCTTTNRKFSSSQLQQRHRRSTQHLRLTLQNHHLNSAIPDRSRNNNKRGVCTVFFTTGGGSPASRMPKCQRPAGVPSPYTRRATPSGRNRSPRGVATPSAETSPPPAAWTL